MRAFTMLLLAASLPSLAVRASDAALASAARPRPILTLDEAINTTKTSQWQLRQAHENTLVAKAQADEARAPLLPQLTGVSYTYERTTANFQPHPGFSSVVASPSSSWKTYNYVNFNGTLSQLVWDFGYTLEGWRAAKDHALSQQETERYTALQVLFTVRTAYFTARANKDLVEVAEQTLADENAHLNQTDGFVKAGTQPRIALATALASVANAEVQLITAQNNYDTAKAQLNQAMGVTGPLDYDVADETLPPVLGEEGTTDELMAPALAQRPDLTSLEQQIRSQQANLASMKGSYYPSIGVAFNWSNIGTAPDNAVWNGNVQATINWNIYQGGLSEAQVEQARATLNALEAQTDGLRQQVRLDVEQARLAVGAAKASLNSASKALTNASEQLRLAEGRFKVGLGSIIELTDAQVAASSAAAQRVQADYNLATARAQLLRALGDLGTFG
jgi:outer membrane protein